jgi:hypothetical protein
MYASVALPCNLHRNMHELQKILNKLKIYVVVMPEIIHGHAATISMRKSF